MSGKEIKEIEVILDDTEWYVEATFYPDDAKHNLKNPVFMRAWRVWDGHLTIILTIKSNSHNKECTRIYNLIEKQN